jgi:GxxExxY protein
MEMNAPEGLNNLTDAVIGAAFEVSNELGCGFLESVYRDALLIELRSRGIASVRERRYSISYKRERIGDYVADLVVADSVIVEVKAVAQLIDAHVSQTINYLRVSNIPLGLLLNFGRPRVEVRRIRA